MVTANEVAAYFLATWPDDAGEGISNLKLQKLCYYAEGFHLALYGKQLFNEDLEAWEHGPVIPGLYHAYKKYGSDPIPVPEDIDTGGLDESAQGLLDEVREVFGQFSAWKLRNMTHEEPPWRDARAAGERVITRQSMREYFETQVE